MMNLLAALLLAALAQEGVVTVFRTEKNDYTGPVARCKEAESLIESDPSGAVERLNEIINNPKVKKIECRIRIEERPSEYTSVYLFTPYLYRGQARMAQAKKSQGEAAQKLLSAAFDDFTESAKRNIAGAQDLAQTAKAELDKMKSNAFRPPDPVKEDPVVKFRELWSPLLSENRFKSAAAVIAKQGQGLSEEQKKGFQVTTETRCREFLVKQVAELRPRFVSALNTGLDSMTAEEFGLAFALPETEELLFSAPPLDWLRKHQAAFRDVQSQKSPASSLTTAAAESAPLEDRFENSWFKSTEHAVFQSFRGDIGAAVEKARDAAKAERDQARAQADALLSAWKAFTGKLDAKFLERHRFVADHDTQLKKLFDAFPSDLAELGPLEESFDAVFAAPSPDDELAKIEEKLMALESRANLSRESRQRLYTDRVIVAALRGLYQGKTEDAVASDLSAFRAKFKEVGGAGAVTKYGPRVVKVFVALR